MNTINFDNQWNGTLFIPQGGLHCLFLLNPFFDNSVQKIKADIAECSDNERNFFLSRVVNQLERSQRLPNTTILEEAKETLVDELEIFVSENGQSYARISNVCAQHSGFWYVYDHISEEIQKIEKRILELRGFKLVDLDKGIIAIRQAKSEDEAIERITTFGLTEFQAKAFVKLRLAEMTSLTDESIDKEIERCKALIRLLNSVKD